MLAKIDDDLHALAPPYAVTHRLDVVSREDSLVVGALRAASSA